MRYGKEWKEAYIENDILLNLHPQSAHFLQILLILEKENLLVYNSPLAPCSLSALKKKDYKRWLEGIIKQIERKLAKYNAEKKRGHLK